MYTYHAFGLNIISDFEIIEFLPSQYNPPADVRIQEGKVPEALPGKPTARFIQGSAQKILFKVANLANFLIENGNTIIYQLHPESDRDSLRLYLLGMGMAAILQQRGYIVLHGNAISTDGEVCNIFVGKSGAGKSTTAAYYYQQGAKILADDVCAIKFDENQQAYVIPSYPQIKLWQTSADLLNISTRNLRRVRPKDNKFAMMIPDQFIQKPMPIAKIFEVNEDKIVAQEIKGMEKLSLLKEHSYRYIFLRRMGIEAPYLKSIMMLATNMEINKISRIVINPCHLSQA